MAGMADARTDEVACSFCLEYGRYLTRPRSLACGHYYCEPCLETDFKTQKVVRCIKCSIVYDVDLYSLPLADTTESTTPVFCDVCSNKGMKNAATIYCVTCTQSICIKHQQSHDDFFVGHKKISTAEYLKQSRKFEKHTCTKHEGQSYMTGCTNCCDVFCVKCTTEPTLCKNGTPHKTLILDELVKHIESEFDILKKDAGRFDSELSAYSKKCAQLLDEKKMETESMLKLLHEARDVQMAAIKTKYDKLEAELIEKRGKIHKEIEDFLSDKLGELLSASRREIQLCEARLRDNHQVDAVRKYKETELLIQNLLSETFPQLKVDNAVGLKKTGNSRNLEVKISPCDQITIAATRQPPHLTTPPTRLELIKEVPQSSKCMRVCYHQGNTYVSLESKAIMRIGQDYKTTLFVNTEDVVTGMAVSGDNLITTTWSLTPKVSVYDLLSGKLVRSWSYSDHNDGYAANVVVLHGKLIIADRRTERLGVYDITGQLSKQIKCPQLQVSRWISMCGADHNSIILSNHGTSRILKISVETGQLLWSSSTVTNPRGVTCFNNQFVFLFPESYQSDVRILDINTGELVGMASERYKRPGTWVFGPVCHNNMLIVPGCNTGKVLFFRIQT